jgi:membrane protease YdiL (CAAX protease family)
MIENTEKESFLQRYELIFFFILTFAITWTSDIIGIIFINHYYPFLIIGAFGPFISALVIIYGTKKSKGLKEFFTKFKKTNGFSRLILIIFIFGMGYVLGSWIMTFFGAKIINPYQSSTIFDVIFNIIIIFFVTTFLTGGNEEPGWRGYALPKLLEKFKPIWAGVILGAIWALWHIPTFFMPTIQRFIPFYLYFTHVVLLSLVFTWLYLKTDGSIIYAMIFHGMSNMLLGLVLDFMDITFDQFLILIFIFLVFEVIIVIALIISEKDQFLQFFD